jgi:hypothetical protein
MRSQWGVTPRQSIEAECRRRGRDAVVDGCVRLLQAGTTDAALLLALAGPAGQKFLDGEEHADTYWLRVWALRGLLWTWDERATSVVVAALRDGHWRVREMALKVVARHRVDDAFEAALRLREDDVARVRSAAERVVVRLAAAGT